MPVENSTTIDGLNISWPLSGDGVAEGDDHLRQEKIVLKTMLPGITGNGLSIPITATEAELNIMDGVIKTTAQINDLVDQSSVQTITGVKTIQSPNISNTTFSGTQTGFSGNVTGNLTGVASSITGQGALATLNSVAAAQIDANAVGSSEIAANAVGSSEIAASAVGNSELAANAVTNAKIGNATINGSKLVNNTLTAAQIASNAITTSELASNAVNEINILNNAITSAKIANDAVGSSEIAANAVGDSELKTDSATRASLSLASLATTVIPSGLYTFSPVSSGVELQVRDSGGTWRGSSDGFAGGAVFSDGVNVRFNNTINVVYTIYYLKLA